MPNLQWFLDQHKLNQATLAKQAGVERTSLNKFLNGERVVLSPAFMLKVARTLHTTIDQIVEFEATLPPLADDGSWPLERARIVNGLSVRELARQAQVSPFALSRIENGHGEYLSETKQEAIAQVLHIDRANITEFKNGKTKSVKTRRIQEDGATPTAEPVPA